MHLWQWAQNASKLQERIDCEEKVQEVLSNSKTIQKTIGDYPRIASYLHEKFADIDVSDVKIYIATAKAMDNAGWGHAGGCYIHHMNLILIKKTMSRRKQKNEFDQLLAEKIGIKLNVEDVLVHELIHAVSGKASRSSRKFVNQEEEFVFTNCIDFYKDKGMTESDIATKVFLPFCVQNVFEDGKTLMKVLSKYIPQGADSLKVLLDPYKLLNKHAEEIIPKIVKKAHNNALKMIDLYKRYGSKTYFVSEAPLMDQKERFASIDLE